MPESTAPITSPTATASALYSPSARFYLPALDGLRTVAFLMVWWHHALRFPPFVEEVPGNAWLHAFRSSGQYGVPIFFVLSAYLITRLLLTEKAQTGGIDLRAYYVRRTLRIWPLYFLVVAIATAQWAHKGAVPTLPILTLSTFTSNWYQAFTRPFENFSSVLWSVSVEEQFYLLWPLVLSRFSTQGMKTLCYGMIALALGARVTGSLAGWSFHSVWLLTPTHLDSLALGTLLALHGAGIVPRGARTLFLVLGACLLLLAVQERVFTTEPYSVFMAVGYTFVPLIATVMVDVAIGSQEGFLTWPWIVSLGRLTFGMYCYHMLFLQFVHVNDALHLAGSLVATFALSWVSYHYYEKRFLRLKHRFERVPSRPD